MRVMARCTAVVASAAVLFFTSTSIAAADEGGCGPTCLPCEGAPSPDWVYGGGTDALGSTYLRYCQPGGSCGRCFSNGPDLKKSSSERADVLLHKLRQADSRSFEMLVRKNGTRLLMHRDKGMVAVLGGCDGTAIVGIAFLPADRMRALDGAGVRSLQGFLSTSQGAVLAQQ